MTKLEILQSALQARIQEQLHYQVDIDNWRLAIEKIHREHAGDSPMDTALSDYAKHLQALHDSAVIEQRKTTILKEVIAAQLEELQNASC